jgi:hypothetical protein
MRPSFVHLETVPSRSGTDFEHGRASYVSYVLEFLDDIGDGWVYPGRVFACPEFIPDRP